MPHGPASGHPETCFGCKLRSVQFGNTMPPPERLIEQQRAKDLPAYKRLRDQGLQPRRTVGCAELETRAESQEEIDVHGLIDPKLLRGYRTQIQDGMALAKESGWSPVQQVADNKAAAGA